MANFNLKFGIENLVDDILQFPLRINNSVGEIFLLQPF
ncbi:hypothetical protein HKM25_2011 [Streptococcus pneumoniae]|nr:hypothetical protein HKM25_2011 [Streptococcus pneumoniae]